MLNGIDIASWQSDLVPSKMKGTDFVIVKATGGVGYANPCCKGHADATLKAGKALGLYHFAQERGCPGSAKDEADYFVSIAKAYIGKATFWLDWEADALALDPSWAKAWLDRVKAQTGVTPGIYMSKSTCRNRDWSSVVKAGYKLWMAQYPNYDPTGYQKDPWTDAYGYGAWKNALMHQYTSEGHIEGYGGRLDLNLFYGMHSNWEAMAARESKVANVASTVKSAVSNARPSSKKAVVSRANVAAQIMEHLCTCPEHGYSQPGRYGTSGYCEVETDVGTVKVKKGDRDCSSAVCEAWELALQGTAWDGKITKTGWTGNMRDMFVGSGLFSWKPMSFDAQRGDVYLAHNSSRQHTAMCTQNDSRADLLAEFSISETGGIDGAPGDQTGRESSVHAYYEGWDGILAYNGKADTVADAPDAKPPKDDGIRFRVSVDECGEVWMKEGAVGQQDEFIRWIAVKGAGKYRVYTEANGWLPWVTGYDVRDLEYGCAGDGSPILAVEIPSRTARYAVRTYVNGWYSDMVGNVDTGGSDDSFAGDMEDEIDGFRVSKA